MKRTFIFKDTDELSVKVADWLVEQIADTLQKQDRFTLALAGGSTPKKLYSLLASEKYAGKIDWEKIHFFWGDERFVPFDDERSNAKMAHDVLLSRVPVNKNNIHIMQTTGIEPEASSLL